MVAMTTCKICGSEAKEVFAMPVSKKTGYPFPDLPDDCPYFECTNCNFLFSTHLDKADHTEVYDDTYWERQDPDWYGRVTQTLRLVMLSNYLAKLPPNEMTVLDFGCGPNGFVEKARADLQMQAWGSDIIPPKFAPEYFLQAPVTQKFDIIVACEVIEHLPFPMESFETIKSMLKPGGVFAFQTAEYDRAAGRDWWYLGPDNGHISLYSRAALDIAFEKLGGKERALWNNYPGVQAWKF